MPSQNGHGQPFAGFSSPNYTQVPDELFDVLMPELSDIELRVCLYIMRRTFGFKKHADNISLKQIVEGITGRDGEQLDHGAGVSKPSAVKAVKGLVEKGIVVATRNRSQARGDEPTTYALRFRQTPVLTALTPPPCQPGLHPRVNRVNTQETVIQETEKISNIEKSHDQFSETDDGRQGSGSNSSVPDQSVSQSIQAASGSQTALEAQEPVAPSASAPEPETSRSEAAMTSPEASSEPSAPSMSFLAARERIRQTLAANMSMDRSREGANRPPVPTPSAAPLTVGEARPIRGRPPGTSDERDRVRAYLTDFMLELHDEASLPASITRAVNLFKQANIPPARWDDYLYQARTITQEHSGSIKKARSQDSGSLAVKNKAPYFFAVLAQLVGLRPDHHQAT